MRGGGGWSDSVPEETLSRDDAERVVRRLVAHAAAVPLPHLRHRDRAARRRSARCSRARRSCATASTTASREHDAAALNTAVVLYLLMAFAAVFLGRLAILLVARVGEAFLRELRKRLFNHLMSLSLDFFEREKTGKIVARMTSDIDSMQELISQGLVLFVQNIFLFCGAVVVIIADVVAARARRARSSCRPCTSRAAGSGACRTRRTSRSATASRRTSRRCRRASKACGSCRRSAVSARSRIASHAPTRTSTKRTSRPSASRRSTSRSSSSPASRARP